MFTRAASLVTFATLALLSAATEPASQCNTGPVQCCNSVQSAGTPSVATLLGSLGIAAQGADVPVGLTCDPISVIGVGGDSCSASPVCCENNSFNGVVALGCVPVDLSL